MRTLIATVLVTAPLLTGQAAAQDKPNILVVWGDDIGLTNISANTHGLVGYRTPNIDRVVDHQGLVVAWVAPKLRYCSRYMSRSEMASTLASPGGWGMQLRE